MKNKVKELLNQITKSLGISSDVELTEAKGHADYSTNIAMKASRELSQAPQVIAKSIIDLLHADFIDHAEVAGPGFINIFVKGNVLSSNVDAILSQAENFGRGNQGKYINVEYVSANPTGHLHLGHARGAAIGSALVNILRFAGNKVDAEYYINDAGNQIDVLGISTFVRYQNLFGVDSQLPEECYRGMDIVDAAKHIAELFGDKYKDSNYEDVKDIFKDQAKAFLLDVIKQHLSAYKVDFNIYSSEQALYKNNLIMPAIEKLSKYTYVHEGALWLKTTLQGDDKDRVLIKSDKSLTYFTPDIAYHDIKLSRGYDELINIWGADHIGYIKRMEVALSFLGLPNNRLDIFTVQLVKLMKDGQELKMSKRKGTSYTIEELLEEVGVDVARFYMLNRSADSQFVFDINEATTKSTDNPVFTVQYTHARANQLLAKGTSEIKAGKYEGKEIELINMLMKFPELVINISTSHKVNLMPQYLIDLSREFNSFYSNSKIIGTEREGELLALVKATKQVINNGLSLLGISAPDKMEW